MRWTPIVEVFPASITERTVSEDSLPSPPSLPFFYFDPILQIFYGVMDFVPVHLLLPDLPPLASSLLICLNPLIPKPLYICLSASPSSSLTILPPNHSLVKRGGKQALVLDGQGPSADVSPWSTLSVAEPGRVEWQAAFTGCTYLPLVVSRALSMCVCVCVSHATKASVIKMAKYTRDYALCCIIKIRPVRICLF